MNVVIKTINVFMMSHNIDFATLTGDTIFDLSNKLPITKRLVAIGFGVQFYFFRIGNIVYGSSGNPVIRVASTGTIGAIQQSNDFREISETMPEGYRPFSHSGIIKLHPMVTGMKGSCSWVVETNGAMHYSANLTETGQDRFNGSWLWITKDTFPTDDIIA